MAKVYSIVEADGNFRSVLHENEHGFEGAQREIAYAFLDETLKTRAFAAAGQGRRRARWGGGPRRRARGRRCSIVALGASSNTKAAVPADGFHSRK